MKIVNATQWDLELLPYDAGDSIRLKAHPEFWIPARETTAKDFPGGQRFRVRTVRGHNPASPDLYKGCDGTAYSNNEVVAFTPHGGHAVRNLTELFRQWGLEGTTDDGEVDEAVIHAEQAAMATLTGVVTFLASVNGWSGAGGGTLMTVGSILLAIVGGKEAEPPQPPSLSAIAEAVREVVAEELDKNDAEKYITSIEAVARDFNGFAAAALDQMRGTGYEPALDDMDEHTKHHMLRRIENLIDRVDNDRFFWTLDHLASNPDTAKWMIPAYRLGIVTGLQVLQIHQALQSGEGARVTPHMLDELSDFLDRHIQGIKNAMEAFDSYRYGVPKENYIEASEVGTKINQKICRKYLGHSDGMAVHQTIWALESARDRIKKAHVLTQPDPWVRPYDGAPITRTRSTASWVRLHPAGDSGAGIAFAGGSLILTETNAIYALEDGSLRRMFDPEAVRELGQLREVGCAEDITVVLAESGISYYYDPSSRRWCSMEGELRHVGDGWACIEVGNGTNKIARLERTHPAGPFQWTSYDLPFEGYRLGGTYELARVVDLSGNLWTVAPGGGFRFEGAGFVHDVNAGCWALGRDRSGSGLMPLLVWDSQGWARAEVPDAWQIGGTREWPVLVSKGEAYTQHFS